MNKLYLDRNLQVVFGVTLMAVLGVSSITPAFPKIISDLGIPPDTVGLLITVFTGPGVLLTPILGITSDRIGRKKVLVPGLLLFGLAGGSCFFAPDFNMLLILRFIQGIGAASIGSMNMTLIGDLFAGSRCETAMGYNASVLSLGTASYPAIGGTLALLGWNYPFLLPLFAIPVALAVVYSLENPKPAEVEDVHEYLSGTWSEVNNRIVAGAFFASIVTFILLYGAYQTYLPILLDSSFEVDSFVIGLILATMSLATAITASQLSRITSRISLLWTIRVGFVFYGVALLLIPFVTELWMIFLPISLFGIGHGMNIPSISAVLAGQTCLDHRGAVMSLNGMVLRMGQSSGPLIMGLFFVQLGLNWVYFIGAILAMVAIVLLLPIRERTISITL